MRQIPCHRADAGGILGQATFLQWIYFHGLIIENLKNLVALLGQREIFFSDSAFVMRGKRQRHLIKTNIYIGMVVHFFSIHSDTINKDDAV